MATRKKHTPKQVVRKLATADRMLNEGKDVADVCRELQVSEQTYYRWRSQFGGMNANDAKRLKDLERAARRVVRRPGQPAWSRLEAVLIRWCTAAPPPFRAQKFPREISLSAAFSRSASASSRLSVAFSWLRRGW
jgi:putative transposase